MGLRLPLHDVELLNFLSAVQAMAAAFGRPADDVFSYISPRPVAAASLGQVYKAQLQPQYGGGEVAVKVQRPGVLEQVNGARAVHWLTWICFTRHQAPMPGCMPSPPGFSQGFKCMNSHIH